MGMGINSVISSSAYTPVQAGQNNQCQVREEIGFDNVGQTITYIDNQLPRISGQIDPVYNFAYTHRLSRTERSAVEIFARTIIPQMAARGYHDLVLEIFPCGGPIEAELVKFNLLGMIGATMHSFFDNLCDKESFQLLLDQARTYGIRLHAGGVDFDNVNQTIWHPDFRTNSWRLRTARAEIVENTGNRVQELILQGQKVFSLNSGLNNDLYPQRNRRSFTEPLDNEFPGRIIEIDLVIPELTFRQNGAKTLPLSPNCDWARFIPQRRENNLTLVSERGRNSYMLFWLKQ